MLIFRRGRGTSFSFSNSTFLWIGRKLTPPSFLGHKTCSSQLLVTVLIPICLAWSCSPQKFVGKRPVRYTGYPVFLTMPFKLFLITKWSYFFARCRDLSFTLDCWCFSKTTTGFFVTWGKLRLQIGVEVWKNVPKRFPFWHAPGHSQLMVSFELYIWVLNIRSIRSSSLFWTTVMSLE